MTGKPWQLGLFFLLCLLIALALNLPAQQVLTWIQLPSAVRVAGVDGTVMRGKASEVVVEKFPLFDVEYRFLPSCIALLKACYRVDYRQGRLRVAYDILNGDIEVSDAQLEYPVTEITRHIPNLLVQPSGRLELIVDAIELVDGRPARLDGRLIWRELGLDDSGTRLDIGDYEVEFVGDAEQYRFKLAEIHGDLDVDGEGEVTADGQYRVDIRIVAGDNVDSRVRSVLDLAAQKVGYNSYRVDRKGRLPGQLSTRLFP